MKKVLSIMLAAVMLCGLFVMPVSAEEDVVWSASAGYFALGANTVLNEDGKVVLDEVGDSFEVVMETDRSGLFRLSGNFWSLNGAHDIATAVEIDGVRLGVADLSASYVKDLFSNNLYYANIEAGRHTIRIVNMRGSYAISSLRFVDAGGTAPTTYSTRASYEYTGTIYKDYRYGCLLNGRNAGGFDLAKNTVIATMGVEEDGLYELSWDIMNYYNGGAAAPDIYNVNVKAGGNVYSNLDAGNADKWLANKDTADTEKMTSDAAYRKQMYGYTTWVNKVLVAQMPLSKGTHQIVIECNEPYNYNCLVDKVYLKKVGEVTYSGVSVFSDGYSKSLLANSSGAGTSYKHVSLGGAGTWIEYNFTVQYDGVYTPQFGWLTTSSNKTAYPRFYVDDACVWGKTITDNSGATDIWYEYQTTALDGIALTAGTHRLRIYNSANTPFYVRKLSLTRTADTGAVQFEAETFNAEKSSGITEAFGNDAKVAEVDAGSYACYYVNVLEDGFYNIDCTFNKANGTSDVIASANGTKAALNIVGDGSANFRTEDMDGTLYLEKGKNEILIRLEGIKTVIDSFAVTPVSYAARVVNPKEGELYEGEVTDANLAKSVKANTEYTAVADVGGALVNKGVALIVAVYEGGVMKTAYTEVGIARIGSKITKTFTTPEADGNYTVKVFVMDSLSSFKPYTEQTEILPAVAE